MRHFVILLAFIVPLLSGCFMHTVMGGWAPSPDKSLNLSMAIHGASRKAFVDKTEKRVYLSIYKEQTDRSKNDASETLFDGKYVFIAAGLCANVQWHASESVTVDFYDYGDKVSRYDVKAGTPSNYIATLTFVSDPITGKFAEKK